MDVRDHTAPSYGGFDKRVQLLVTTDGELQVTRSDALYLEILGRITCQLQHLGSEVLQDCGAVHCSGGTNSSMACGASLQMSVDAAHGELKERLSEW